MDLAQYKQILTQINSGNGIPSSSGNGTIMVTIPNTSLVFTVVDKTIHTQIALDDILVQGDKLSRKLHFAINRYFDGEDLSDNKDILINFKNAKGETGFQEVTNVVVTNDFIEFDWWVDSTVTALEGQVKIQLEIVGSNQVGDVIYRYQTIPFNLEIEKTVVSNGSAQPVDYYLDIKFLDKYSNPVVYTGMASSIAPIEIQNRTIVMPALEDIVVTQDTNSRLITFKFYRYVDNVDLSLKTPCIKYKLLNGDGDRSVVCNQTITPTEMQFDWLIDSKVTSLPGRVEFSIEFIGYNDRNEFYCYNTLPSYIFVSKGLDVDNIIEQPNPSWIQSWNIIADKYLRDYLKYVQDTHDSTSKALKAAEEALLSAQKAKASEVSSENNSGISWQQADRAERMANIANGYKDSVDNTMKLFNTRYDKFYQEYQNIRKKDEPISELDLATSLKDIINNKAEKYHVHNAIDIIQDPTHRFVTDDQINAIRDARLKTNPIREGDLDVDLVNKINSGGSGTPGGGVINGAEIDDTAPSYSKVYSSQNTENKINSAVASGISGITGLSDNNFTDELKRKLDRIEDGANNFTITTLSAAIIEETATKKFTSPAEKLAYLDKYTKAEVDNLLSKFTAGLDFKASVPTYNDILTTYPNPIKGWTVEIANGERYYFDGTQWIYIGSGQIPLATVLLNGLMSSIDKEKLDGIENNANNYIHPNTHSADMIDETNDRRFVTTAILERILDWDSELANILSSYRKNTTKIVESDIDQTLLDKFATIGGTIISDLSPSTSKTYSSVKIDSQIQNMADTINTKIDEIDNDVATIIDLEDYFTTW